MNLEQAILFFRTSDYPCPPLLVATIFGVDEILEVFFRYFPDLFFQYIARGANILGGAMLFRQEKIFKRITKMSTFAQYLVASSKDESKNTLLHLAAILPPSGSLWTSQLLSVSGAAFHLQKELQWFQVKPIN